MLKPNLQNARDREPSSRSVNPDSIYFAKLKAFPPLSAEEIAKLSTRMDTARDELLKLCLQDPHLLNCLIRFLQSSDFLGARSGGSKEIRTKTKACNAELRQAIDDLCNIYDNIVGASPSAHDSATVLSNATLTHRRAYAFLANLPRVKFSVIDFERRIKSNSQYRGGSARYL